jgi:ElaB/YqjD/DUF883 family membrane-anchored ribosome-binding protein
LDALIYNVWNIVRQEDEMAGKDAEMPAQRALSDDIQEIANHLANLRKDLEVLTGQIKRTSDHQLERMQDTAGEALKAVEGAVRQNPISALGIALGLGFLVGIVLPAYAFSITLPKRRSKTKVEPGLLARVERRDDADSAANQFPQYGPLPCRRGAHSQEGGEARALP